MMMILIIFDTKKITIMKFQLSPSKIALLLLPFDSRVQ
jgi:hypothetical protein